MSAVLEARDLEAAVVDRTSAPRSRARVEGIIGITLLAAILLGVTMVRIFQIGDPNAPNLGEVFASPSLEHPFGTDSLGRDVFLRTLYAGWIDIGVSLLATATAVVIGLTIGVVAAYKRGAVDSVLMRITDAMIAFPFLILGFAIVTITGPGALIGLYFALVAKGWPAYARISRGETLVVREQDYVHAARTLGLGPVRILVRHVVPNVVRPCLVFSFADLIVNILLITTLSYLGLGIQPPTAEWGAIIAEGQTYIFTAWWISTLPGIFVVLFGVSVSFLGEALGRVEGSWLGAAGGRG
ncbi:MAG TPA: ABC transporter permease [Solirubrobacterales bacterium]|nr:ABC transporter permease [Solirubrobacterales bacterium]